MKKTATITFHNSVNYGAILQTYALQQSILKLKIKNEIINYSPDSDRNLIINTKNLKTIIKSLIKLPDFYLKRKKFNNFINRHIYITDRLNRKILNSKTFNNEYDIFISGSDQVWNHEILKDSTYFLDFVKDNSKKRSYAASFGIEKIPFNLKIWYEKNLKDFHTILVREQVGKFLIKEIINKDARVVLDPVFLLNKVEWDNILFNTKFENMKNNYILIYYSTPKIKKFAEFLSKKYNIPIFFISEIVLKKKYRVGKLERRLGPEEFISAIKNARFILTASFHAVVFSIIYNKIFYIDYMSNGRESRLEQILNLFDIKNRKINEQVENYKEDYIDWESINKKLEIERNKSINELKKMLGVND